METAEYKALRHGVGLAQADWIATLELTGNDRVEWLQGLFSNDLKKLAVGQGCYGAHLTVKGKMIADLTVHARAESLFIVTEASARKAFVEALDRYLIREEVEIRDHVGTWDEINVAGPATPDDALVTLRLEGPQALAALAAVYKTTAFAQVPDLPEHGLVELFDGEILIRTRSGYDLHVARKQADELHKKLAPHTTPVALADLEVVRVEDGIPRFGIDMDENTIPIEAGLEARAVSYTKGCYVGQEVIARIHSQGHVNRNLVGLVLDALPEKGTKLKTPERELGWTTSAVHSPALGRPIALGYVRRDHAKPGVKLDASGIPAEVHPLPFVTSAK